MYTLVHVALYSWTRIAPSQCGHDDQPSFQNPMQALLFCRIDLNFVIKVADFGLTERLGVAKDYIRQTQDSNIKLPLKWMAPESMNDRVFSEHSDVVSNCGNL